MVPTRSTTWWWAGPRSPSTPDRPDRLVIPFLNKTLAENVAESLDRGTRVMVVGRLEQRSWENQEGEKRSKVEVVADEVGPSLRWATASVSKNERRGGDGGYDGPWGGVSRQSKHYHRYLIGRMPFTTHATCRT